MEYLKRSKSGYENIKAQLRIQRGHTPKSPLPLTRAFASEGTDSARVLQRGFDPSFTRPLSSGGLWDERGEERGV